MSSVSSVSSMSRTQWVLVAFAWLCLSPVLLAGSSAPEWRHLNGSYEIASEPFLTKATGVSGSHTFLYMGRKATPADNFDYFVFKATPFSGAHKRAPLEFIMLEAAQKVPGVIRLETAFTDGQNNFIIGMEYCEYGNLIEHERHNRGKLKIGARGREAWAKDVVFELANAVLGLNRQRISHLDLKPGNAVLCRASGGQLRPKIIDFGAARRAGLELQPLSLGGNEKADWCYQAPELIGNGIADNEKADVFSLGAITYWLLTGKHLLGDTTKNPDGDCYSSAPNREPGVLEHVIDIRLRDAEQSLSRTAYDLVTHTLQTDPTKRIDIDAVVTHPWFSTTSGSSDRPESATGDARPKLDSEQKTQLLETESASESPRKNNGPCNWLTRWCASK